MCAVVVLTAAILLLAGCGSGAKHGVRSIDASDPVAPQATTPREFGPKPADGTVARVGSRAITVASFNQRVGEELDSEPSSQRLSPPAFAACAARSKETLKAAGASGEALATAALVKRCRQSYEGLRAQVLEHLISSLWVIEGARELGVDVTPAEAKSKFKIKQLTLAARTNLDAEAIRQKLSRSVEPMSSAAAARFYASHRGEFTTPEERDLAIVRTGTKPTGVAVRGELAAGVSPKSIAKRFPIRQPIYSKDGLVRGLKPGVYREAKLDHAIFNAHIGEVRGPIKTVIGYYVFVVRAIRPGHHKPLAVVEAAIKRAVPEQLRQRALARFVAGWRARWTARTSCSPGYVVRKCRESPLARETRPGTKYSLE
jgi:PPIC-type PPIASE domain